MKKYNVLLAIGFISFGLLLLPIAASAALIEITTIDPTRAAIPEAVYGGGGGSVNTGSLLGVFSGNDSNQQGDIEDWLIANEGYDSSFELIQEAKIEANAGKAGGWAGFSDIMLYVVKANNAFALYELNPPTDSGGWSTYDIWVRGFSGPGGLDISHFTLYNGVTSVPEPGTFLLLGAGIIGMAAIGRKRFV